MQKPTQTLCFPGEDVIHKSWLRAPKKRNTDTCGGNPHHQSGLPAKYVIPRRSQLFHMLKADHEGFGDFPRVVGKHNGSKESAWENWTRKVQTVQVMRWWCSAGVSRCDVTVRWTMHRQRGQGPKGTWTQAKRNTSSPPPGYPEGSSPRNALVGSPRWAARRGNEDLSRRPSAHLPGVQDGRWSISDMK